MLALDVARIEAGLLLIEVDFASSKKAMIAAQAYTPYEMGLGRLVNLDKGRFVGRQALRDEQRRGHARQVVGLEIEWTDVERIYEKLGLPPAVSAVASRVAVPVYRSGRQVGKATSTTWSPVLKKMIALATIDRPYFARGDGAADGGHRRGGAAPGPRQGRGGPVLQSRPKNRDPAPTRRS